jgi:heme exporter protein D
MLDLDMGKYAVYVWPAYAVSAAVLIIMIWDSLARASRWRRAAEDRQDDQPPEDQR